MKFCSKRALTRIAIGLGLLAGLALVVNGAMAWRAQHRLSVMVAELRAAGEPASLADLAPKPIPPEKNAAAVLEAMTPQLRAFESVYDKFDNTPLGEQLDERREKGQSPNGDQLAAMRSILDSQPTILPGLHDAAACEQYASLRDFSQRPSKLLDTTIEDNSLTLIRMLQRYVAWKMMVLVAEGNSDEAILLGIQMLRLARLRDIEPLLVNYLVSVAVREAMFQAINDALCHNQVSPAVRAELDAELALQDSREPFRQALRSERAFAIPFVMEQSGVVPAIVRWPMLNWMIGELDVENQAYNALKLPLDRLMPKWDPASQLRRPPVEFDLSNSRLMGTTILAVFNADVRRLAHTRCLRVRNALGEYRQRDGKEAENLEQLSLPREAMTDPYSGKPLLLKMTDQGRLIYSVAENGIDDGGEFKDMKDWGLGPPGYPRE